MHWVQDCILKMMSLEICITIFGVYVASSLAWTMLLCMQANNSQMAVPVAPPSDDIASIAHSTGTSCGSRQGQTELHERAEALATAEALEQAASCEHPVGLELVHQADMVKSQVCYFFRLMTLSQTQSIKTCTCGTLHLSLSCMHSARCARRTFSSSLAQYDFS